MIVHFMFDEKIANYLIENFVRANPSNNLFLIIKESPNEPLQHVSQGDHVYRFNRKHDDINTILKDARIQAIICHILNIEFADILLKMHQKVDLYWSIWGYDVYSLARIKPSLYAPLTLKYLRRTNLLQDIIWFINKNRIVRTACYALTGRKDPYSKLEYVQSQIKACLTYIKEDVDILKEYYPSLRMGYIYFPLLNLHQYIGSQFSDIQVNGKNILVGNSNTETCNHLDVFSFLSQHGGKDEKIYVPLSYGGDNKYKETVVLNGKQTLGKRFVPMLDFISLAEYTEILRSCGTGIFYHYRQQGMGNIIAMLWMGARIYMAGRNPAYQFLKRIGIKVFDLDRDFKIYQTHPLSNQDVEMNKSILSACFSPHAVEQQYRITMATIQSRAHTL